LRSQSYVRLETNPMDAIPAVYIPPLRKRTDEGKLYTRTGTTEQTLLKLKLLSRDEVQKRCEIRDRTDPSYVTSECLLHLVRECRHDNSDRYFERLYKIFFCHRHFGPNCSTLRPTLHGPIIPRGQVLLALSKWVCVPRPSRPRRVEIGQTHFPTTTAYSAHFRMDGRGA
jgi:hypothetical protein